jgi:PIN domain nuclease of toxin-antitoxin system
MKLLLDTHIWLWSVLEPERLSRRTEEAIKDPGNELWLSSISLWELIVLKQNKRILPDQDLEAWIPKALRSLPLQEAAITHEVARETGRLQLAHGDPADRFLVATAKIFELTLVTADERLTKVREVPILS